MPDNNFQWQQLAANTANTGVQTAMGLALEGHNDRRQLRQQQRLQALQMQGNKSMMDYSFQKQLDMWKATSYQAQVEQMKLAGINPALIYGMSGGGGQTTGTPQGSVTGADAPKGGQEIQTAIGMGLQMQLQKAQIQNIQAQTEKTKGESANLPATGEKIKTETASLLQGIENAKSQKALTDIETELKQIEQYIKGKTQNMAISIISTAAQEANEKLEVLKNDRTISDATKQDKIDQIRANLIGTWLDNALTNAQTTTEQHKPGLIETQRTAMIKAWVQKWKEIELQGRNTDTHAAVADNQIWVNDMAESTKLPVDIINKALQAIILKNILTPGGRNPIQGFKTNQ